eukprot:TRINITY_DN23747_c0_g1_i1.p1 TRINITY_DN23747_c0_g1~~TRINITY_DN23747_c0_g1_i1.p1  ORF type:complete len:112 (-),score=30.95 TRINITY_DN23747_c0_g1_i1:49-384(-)
MYIFCGEEPWKAKHQVYIQEERFMCRRNGEDFLPKKQIQKLQDDAKENKEEVDNICRIISRCFSTEPMTRESSCHVMSEIEGMMNGKTVVQPKKRQDSDKYQTASTPMKNV